jgi:dinuclear metal center YbgI/SA1388 family protein
MSVELGQLTAAFEKLWPLSGAEEWDTPGLVTGNPSQRVSRVLLTVDVTSEIITESIDGEFDLVLAHHPYLLRGVNSLAETFAKGATLSNAIRAGVSIFSAHTNADVVATGVSAVMAEAFGIQNAKPLVATAGASIGHGRIGHLAAPIKLGDFARLIAKVLPSTATGVRVAGNFDQEIKSVAVCGGAGDSLIGAAVAAGADVYVTSDLRHHPVQDAREQSLLSGGTPAMIDVAHWASEWLWLEVAAGQLSKLFPNVQFVVSQIRTDPWDFVVTQ